MNLTRTRSRLQQLTAAALALGVFGAVLGAEAAQAATVVATPTSPPFYVLKKPKAACKAHYVKRTVRIKRRRHGKFVRVKQVRCVYARTWASNGSSRPGGSPSFPANLPTGTVTVGILPTVSGHTYTTTVGQALSVGGNGVLAGASGSGLNALVVSGPPSGSLTLSRNGSFSYTPAKGASGIVRFTYKATSSSGESSTPATITIKVAPTASDATYAVAAGGTLTIPAGGLLAGSAGSGLQTNLVSGPADGTLSLGANGSATYTAQGGFSGQDDFSFDVVDGSSLHSSAAVVTLNVGAHPPVVGSQVFHGALPNTELQVGASSAGPAVRILGSNALSGDSDPNGGFLSVAPGAIVTIDGGVVNMSAGGDFTYDPPAGFSGSSDSFAYTVNESEGLSASAFATIDFVAAPQVWYLDDRAAAGGNGTSASPFNSPAALAGAGVLLPNDVVYLAGGGAPYDGGITLGQNETLTGSGSPLVVAGTMVQGAVSPAPVVTNTGGAGITVSDGDSISGLTVSGTSGDGVYAHNVGAFSLDASVTVKDAAGADVDIDGGNGPITLDARLGGTAGHSLLVVNRTGGAVTASGAIGGSGGVLVQNDSGASVNLSGPINVSSGAQPAFAAIGGGSVTATDSTSTLATTTARALQVSGGSSIGNAGLTFLSISAGSPSGGPDHGIYLASAPGSGQVELAVLGTSDLAGPVAGSGGTIENTTGDAVYLANTTAAVQLEAITIDNAGGNGVEASNAGALGLDTLHISAAGADGIHLTGDGSADQSIDFQHNTISGQPGAGISVAVVGPGTHPTIGKVTNNTVSGSSAGDGIDLTASSAGALTIDAELNTISNIAAGTGVNAQSADGSTLELTLQFNGVNTSGQNGIAVTETGTPGTLCVDPEHNVVQSAANDITLAQLSAGGAFDVGGAWDGISNLAAYLTINNNGAGAAVLPNAGAFTAQSCATVPPGLPV